MKLKLNLTNKTNIFFEKQWFQALIKNILSAAGQKEDSEISLIFVKKPLIKKINQKWRHKNKATTVITFVEKDVSENFALPPTSYHYLGEIFLCPSEVKRQARKTKISTKKMMTKILVHAILHLLGYTHLTEKTAQLMERQEKLVFQKIFPPKFRAKFKFKI